MNNSKAFLTRTREINDINPHETIGTRQALLAALVNATGDGQSELSPEEFDHNGNAYYTLTTEEMEALVNGNIEKIESWVRTLDKGQATRLLYWLQKEEL